MRIASLIALSIFLPVFVHASVIVNINTASLTTLETLPHIGATLAQRIIDYRTQNGLFTSIKDLQKVNGIGSGSNYADIAPLVTVGDAGTTNAVDTSNASDVASSTPSQGDTSHSSGSASTYAPPPSDISVTVTSAQDALVEVPVVFNAVAKAKGGAIDSAAQLTWSFGDGSSAVGSEVSKTFRYAGTYPVIVLATDGSAKARGEMIVSVASANVHIAALSADGITIANASDSRIDLSGWRITSSKGTFRMPEGTTILPNASVLFPFFVMNFPVVSDAVLTYPNGVVAARYVPASVESFKSSSVAQPALATTSYIQAHEAEQPVVSKAEQVIGTNTIVTSHAKESVTAPAAATELATAGAALPDAAGAAPAARSIFRSPWTLGLLGVMITAAGAFVLL